MSDRYSPTRALLGDRHTTLENIVVLYITQAMLGLVSPELRAVAVELREDRLVVHFAYAEDTPANREDVEDALADLEALLDDEDIPADWLIETCFYVGSADGNWPGRAHRRVFETKRPAFMPGH